MVKTFLFSELTTVLIFGIGPCIDSFIPFNYKVVVPPPRSLASWDGSQANSRYRAKWSSVLVFCKTSLYIWGHVMSLSTTSFLFWLHALMHGTSIAYINMYMHAFCREKINKMETDIQREQSIIYMPWLLVWSDQERRNHIDRSMQCNAIAVGACMHAPRSQLLFHACIALHLHGRSTYVYTCVRILELAVRWNVSVAYIVSGCPAGASIVSLCCSAASAYIYVHACVSVLVLASGHLLSAAAIALNLNRTYAHAYILLY